MAPVEKAIKIFAKKNALSLCSGLGIACFAASCIFTATGTVNAVKKIDKLKTEGKNKPTKKDKIKAAAPYYIPAAIAFAGGTVAVIAGNKMATAKIAALSSAIQISEKEIERIEETATEVLGEDKAKELKDAVRVKSAKENKPEDMASIIDTGKGNTIIYDPWSGRYLRASIGWVERAYARLNTYLNSQDEVTLNDFYDILGLPETKCGDDYKWYINSVPHRTIEPDPSYGPYDDSGEPMYIIGFSVKPKNDAR